MKLSYLFTAIIFVSLLVAGAFGQKRGLNSELRTLVAGAANTLDSRELEPLLSDDYTQAEVSDKGSAVVTKARILNQLRNVPEVFKPFVERVSTKSEVTNLMAVRNGGSAVFTANLVVRSTLKMSPKPGGKTLVQVERYEISGGAARVGGVWKLTSLRRTRTMAKESTVRSEEAKGNKAFDVAVFGLLLEGAARAKAANPEDFY
jgi:hypothetical protein